MCTCGNLDYHKAGNFGRIFEITKINLKPPIMVNMLSPKKVFKLPNLNFLSILFFFSSPAEPVQSPMHLYASKIQARSVTINWRYNENPPVGELVGFYISYYLQDERYPNQNGDPIRENLLYEVANLDQIDFSYIINEHLSPGVSYNVYVAAITDRIQGGGDGPLASMSVTTLRTGIQTNLAAF